ncbi:hypothetical protein NQD34_012522 [Periophthalmus magnuspinnatus]|nr:hypothetical protein NQD34_012522 [Periophthalmus magnuspinnatus]
MGADVAVNAIATKSRGAPMNSQTSIFYICAKMTTRRCRIRRVSTIKKIKLEKEEWTSQWAWHSGRGTVDVAQWAWHSGRGTVDVSQWAWHSGRGTVEVEPGQIDKMAS